MAPAPRASLSGLGLDELVRAELEIGHRRSH
jgi:hypothetical protein